MIRGRVAGALLVLVGAAGAAAADDPPDNGFIGLRRATLEIDDCPTVPQLAEAEVDRLATERYNRGDVLYTQGDYPGAVAEFVQFYCLLQAYPLAPYHSVLKDIGQAYERMVEYERAINYYERYVIAIPACDTDPACRKRVEDDRRNMASRIQVLQRLPSAVQVATEPPGADVVIASAAGPQATGRDDTQLSVTAGTYTLKVEKRGFEPIEREIVVGIGRPYSYSFRLTPKRGRLRIQAVPGDAKIYVDRVFAGVGAFDGEVTLGAHQVLVEAGNREPKEQAVEVLGGAPTTLSVELPPPRERGRTQMILAATGVGGLLGLSGAGSATDDAGNAFVGLLVGAGAGALGGYFLVPDDLSLGQSSFVITTTLAGFADGALLGGLIAGNADDSTTQIRSVGAGAVVGATIGAAVAVIAAPGLDPSPGDAAVYNSGAVWGGVAGTLFTGIFSGSSRVESAITLTGLNVGVLTGGLLASRYDFSRRRVVYIDLAGLAGLTVGAAISATASSASNDVSGESTTHFALAGLGVGLGLGVFLTRYMDAPRLPALTPQLTPARDPAGGSSWVVSLGGSL